MIRLRADEADDLLRRAGEEGQHLHLVEGGHDRASTYEAFATALALPGWFGRNLDALHDCLADVAGRHDGAWTLLWRPVAGSAAARDAAVVAVLEDVEHEHAGLTVAVTTDDEG